MADHDSVVLSAKIGEKTISLPPIDIKNKDYFFCPINMKLTNGTLKYCTASPLCKINDMYVFYSDNTPKYELDGKAELLFLSKADALNSYKIKLDKEISHYN